MSWKKHLKTVKQWLNALTVQYLLQLLPSSFTVQQKFHQQRDLKSRTSRMCSLNKQGSSIWIKEPILKHLIPFFYMSLSLICQKGIVLSRCWALLLHIMHSEENLYAPCSSFGLILFHHDCGILLSTILAHICIFKFYQLKSLKLLKNKENALNCTCQFLQMLMIDCFSNSAVPDDLKYG